MVKHALLGPMVCVSLIVWSAALVIAAEKTHEGMVVSASAGQLVMVDKEGKNEHSHKVESTAKVTLNGKPAKLSDLQKGDKIKVTTENEGNVVSIAATRGNG